MKIIIIAAALLAPLSAFAQTKQPTMVQAAVLCSQMIYENQDPVLLGASAEDLTFATTEGIFKARFNRSDATAAYFSVPLPNPKYGMVKWSSTRHDVRIKAGQQTWIGSHQYHSDKSTDANDEQFTSGSIKRASSPISDFQKNLKQVNAGQALDEDTTRLLDAKIRHALSVWQDRAAASLRRLASKPKAHQELLTKLKRDLERCHFPKQSEALSDQVALARTILDKEQRLNRPKLSPASPTR